jgi:hypothetical protein
MPSKKNGEKSANRPKTGKGAMNGHETGPAWTSENQPSPEAKKKGWAKRRTLLQLLELATLNKLPGSEIEWRQRVADAMGIPENEVTVANIMEFRQIEKAIKKADTAAFTAIYDRAYGRPKQIEDDQPIVPPEERQRASIDLGSGITIQIG